MTGKWSGLAPAVDAHLAQWSTADHAKELVKALLESQAEGNAGKVAAKNFLANPYCARWAVFSASYGLPDRNGLPQKAVIPSPGGREGINAAMATLSMQIDGATIAGREQNEGDSRDLMQAALMCHRERLMLDAATSYYVSGDVVDLVTTLAMSATAEPLWPSDIFCPAGFAVLEKPLIVPDFDPDTGFQADDLHSWVRAIGWHRHGAIGSLADKSVGEGVSVFFYTTAEDYANGYHRDMLRSGRTPMVHPEDIGPGFRQIDVLPWRFGMDWRPRSDPTYVPGTVPLPIAYQRRWFLAFCRLQWQQLVVHHREETKRVDNRRWERLANRKQLLDYTVLRLRRETDPVKHHETGTGRPLDHRVLVRLYPKQQYYPSLGPARLPDGSMNPESHRLIWIDPHWRGPEDGPMGPIHPATSFTR